MSRSVAFNRYKIVSHPVNDFKNSSKTIKKTIKSSFDNLVLSKDKE